MILSCKHGDNAVKYKSGEVAIIYNFESSAKGDFVITKDFMSKIDLFEYPLKSTQLSTYVCDKIVSGLYFASYCWYWT